MVVVPPASVVFPESGVLLLESVELPEGAAAVEDAVSEADDAGPAWPSSSAEHPASTIAAHITVAVSARRIRLPLVVRATLEEVQVLEVLFRIRLTGRWTWHATPHGRRRVRRELRATEQPRIGRGHRVQRSSVAETSTHDLGLQPGHFCYRGSDRLSCSDRQRGR